MTVSGPYMTPGRFRIGGYGVDLTNVEDVELRAILHRSTAIVNEYCNVPGGHDFRGGTITDEVVPFRVEHELLPAQRRFFPMHRPVRELVGMRIDVSNTQYLGFDSNEMYVTEDFVEVTSLNMTGVGLFGAAVIPMGLQIPAARVSYVYGQEITVTEETIEQTDAKTYRAMNQFWLLDPAPVVYVGGSTVDTADYTVNATEGLITFDTIQAAGAEVVVDYVHKLPSAIAEATGMVAVERLGDRNLTRKGLHGLVELAVGEVRIRRDFPRAGVQKIGVSDQVAQLLDPYRFITIRGGTN